jgi:hypothetical protein
MIDLREVKHAEQRGCNVYVGERPQIQANETQRHVLDMGRRQLLHGAAHCQNLQQQAHFLFIYFVPTFMHGAKLRGQESRAASRL